MNTQVFNYPKQYRLLTKKQYDLVFSKGKRKTSRHFIFFIHPNSYDNSRLGLVITRKCLPHAVDRNRIKRLLKESFRLHQDDLNHLDIVVLAKYGIKEVVNPELNQELSEQWKKLNEF